MKWNLQVVAGSLALRLQSPVVPNKSRDQSRAGEHGLTIISQYFRTTQKLGLGDKNKYHDLFLPNKLYFRTMTIGTTKY